MARKVFESDADETEGADSSKPSPVRRAPLIRGGAAAPKYIQGSTQTASERSHEDIPVDQIQDSAIEDRIDVTEGLDELVSSIRRNGQQIPIVVRIVNAERPYEIVAGRRRLAAIRQIGQKTIRGFITRMSDKEAFVAQGIENSARLETSFIERSRAAVKAYDAGFDQADVSEFLGISQTLISFMVRIYSALGDEVVVAVGPARGVGRRKWEALVGAAKSASLEAHDLAALVDRDIVDSAERFEALLAAATSAGAARKEAPAPRPTEFGREFMGGQYASTRRPRQLTIKGSAKAPQEFLDFLEQRLPELVEEYRQGREKTDNAS